MFLGFRKLLIESVLPLYFLLSTLFSGCCTQRRDIDSLGVPIHAKAANIVTRLSEAEIKSAIRKYLRKQGAELIFSSGDCYISTGIRSHIGNYLIRFRISFEGSDFYIVPQWAKNKLDWKHAVNCQPIGNEAFSYIVEMISTIEKVSVTYKVRKLLWCWELRCRCKS